MKRFDLFIWIAVAVLGLSALLSACSGGGSSSGSPSAGEATQGAVNLSLTDAPGDYDHVWITVRDVWFHTDANAGPNDPAWLKYPLQAPVLVDLAALSNGNISETFWNGIQLPVGVYKQIRLFLVATDAANPPSGHSHFNETVIGNITYPLRVPDADEGISLVGTFSVTDGSTRKLVIEFNIGDDIVDFNGSEYILKPRLACFDLDNAAAIVGQISTGATFTSAPNFVIKAESLSADGTHHVVRRSTTPDSTGNFILYPVSASTNTYDVLIRGIGYETTIVKGVPVVKGTTPKLNPTQLPLISMVTGTDYKAGSSIPSPTGAWVDFYQTLQSADTGTNEVPYEVRFRHFNPITGAFSGFLLSNSQIRWGAYDSSTITFTAVNPVENVGGYQAIAGSDEELYNPSAFPGPGSPNFTSSAPTFAFNALTVVPPYSADSISGMISMASSTAMDNKMNTGVVFAVHRGLIVNAVSTFAGTLSQTVVSTGGDYTISNLAGGGTTTSLPSAFYGVDAVFWSSTPPAFEAIAFPPQFVDLRTGDATADLTMFPFPCW